MLVASLLVGFDNDYSPLRPSWAPCITNTLVSLAQRRIELAEQRSADFNEDVLFPTSVDLIGVGYCVLTTYDTLRIDGELNPANNNSGGPCMINHRWDMVVLDEGQRIRNPASKTTKELKRLKTPHRVLLSGTPIQNSLLELWSLYDFVFPGRLGNDAEVFDNEFGVRRRAS